MSDNRTALMCSAYKSGIKVKEIAAQFGVQSPAVWKALRRGGVLPPYCPRVNGGAGRPKGGGQRGYTENRLRIEVATIAAREAKEPPRPSHTVDRDPCFMCGVRGDIGCEHRR